MGLGVVGLGLGVVGLGVKELKRKMIKQLQVGLGVGVVGLEAVEGDLAPIRAVEVLGAHRVEVLGAHQVLGVLVPTTTPAVVGSGVAGLGEDRTLGEALVQVALVGLAPLLVAVLEGRRRMKWKEGERRKSQRDLRSDLV